MLSRRREAGGGRELTEGCSEPAVISRRRRGARALPPLRGARCGRKRQAAGRARGGAPLRRGALRPRQPHVAPLHAERLAAAPRLAAVTRRPAGCGGGPPLHVHVPHQRKPIPRRFVGDDGHCARAATSAPHTSRPAAAQLDAPHITNTGRGSGGRACGEARTSLHVTEEVGGLADAGFPPPPLESHLGVHALVPNLPEHSDARAEAFATARPCPVLGEGDACTLLRARTVRQPAESAHLAARNLVVRHARHLEAGRTNVYQGGAAALGNPPKVG